MCRLDLQVHVILFLYVDEEVYASDDYEGDEYPEDNGQVQIQDLWALLGKEQVLCVCYPLRRGH